MSTRVKVYRCNECGEEFEVDNGGKASQVCPECGSMNIRFLRVRDEEDE